MAGSEHTVRARWAPLSVFLVLALTGCFKHTYVVGAGAPAAPLVYDEWRHHWLGGLINPDSRLELQAVCPGGSNATIHQEQTFLNGLVGVLTVGIYVPRTVKVRCAGGGADLDLGEDEVRRIIADPVFLDRLGALLPERVAEAEEAVAALAQQSAALPGAAEPGAEQEDG